VLAPWEEGEEARSRILRREVSSFSEGSGCGFYVTWVEKGHAPHAAWQIPAARRQAGRCLFSPMVTVRWHDKINRDESLRPDGGRLTRMALIIAATPTEMQSMSENDFECFTSTGIKAPGTMLPKRKRTPERHTTAVPALAPDSFSSSSSHVAGTFGSNSWLLLFRLCVQEFADLQYKFARAEGFLQEIRCRLPKFVHRIVRISGDQ